MWIFKIQSRKNKKYNKKWDQILTLYGCHCVAFLQHSTAAFGRTYAARHLQDNNIFTITCHENTERKPRPLHPRKELRYPLHGPLSRCGWLRKISPPPGFKPQNVQPVASRYTDWANPVSLYIWVEMKTRAQRYSEASVTIYQTTRYQNSEDLKSCLFF
jgi:hypothetical protein